MNTSDHFNLTGYESRAYCATDLFEFSNSRGLSISDITSVFSPGGMSVSAFAKQIGKGNKVLLPPMQVLMRLYLRHPETIPMPEKISVSEFFDELGGEEKIASRFRGVLFGVDRNCGYNWERNSKPISTVQSAMLAVMKLKELNSLTSDETLKELIDIANSSAGSLHVNPMKEGSWGRQPDSFGDAMVLSIDDIGHSKLKKRGRYRKNSKTKENIERTALIKMVEQRI